LRNTHSLTRAVAALTFAVPGMLLAAPIGPAHAARTVAVVVKGTTARWLLSSLRIRSMDRIPHTEWRRGYRSSFYRFFVLDVTLTNMGPVMADPYDDLTLTLKVKPMYPTRFTAGWTSLRHVPVFDSLYREASRLYGGVAPWRPTTPRATTTYVYVIATNRGDAHYGLYNAPPYKKYVFLLDTGV